MINLFAVQPGLQSMGRTDLSLLGNKNVSFQLFSAARSGEDTLHYLWQRYIVYRYDMGLQIS